MWRIFGNFKSFFHSNIFNYSPPYRVIFNYPQILEKLQKWNSVSGQKATSEFLFNPLLRFLEFFYKIWDLEIFFASWFFLKIVNIGIHPLLALKEIVVVTQSSTISTW